MRLRRAVVAAAWALAGCTEPGSLVDHEQWQETAEEADPLAAHRPDPVDCPTTEWRVEDGALEVETGVCNYLALTQPSLRQVPEGTTIHVVLWFSTLDAVEPGEAHAAVVLGDEIAWEVTVDIPHEPDVHDIEVSAPSRLEVGDPVGFHLHNHGDNAWTLFTVEIPD